MAFCGYRGCRLVRVALLLHRLHVLQAKSMIALPVDLAQNQYEDIIPFY
jgi:hypothetical protein